MVLNETHGIVTSKDNSWNDICDLIVDYVYDIDGGLNSTPFTNQIGNGMIPVDITELKSYYKYKYLKDIPENLIPKWCGHFMIYIIVNMPNNGTFKKSKSVLKDGKLDFVIMIRDIINDGPDGMKGVLVHEFRHAYTDYLEKSKNINLFGDNATYNMALEYIPDGVFNVISNQVENFIEIKRKVLFSPKDLTMVIASLIYITNNDETNAFIEKYAKQLRLAYNENMPSLVKEINLLKNRNKFSNITKREIINNYMTTLSVTPYNIDTFCMYKSYMIFCQCILDELTFETAYETFDISGGLIEQFIGKYNKDMNEYDKIVKAVKKAQPILQKTLNKMFIIWYDYICEIQADIDTKKTQKITLSKEDLEFIFNKLKSA